MRDRASRLASRRTSVSIALSRHPCPARAGFWAPTGDGVVEVRTDFKLVVPRAEVRCSPWPYCSCVVAVCGWSRGEPLEPWPVAGCVQEVRWPSGPPLLRWPDAHGPALLHQRRCAPARRVAFQPSRIPMHPLHPLCTRSAPDLHPPCTHMRPQSAGTCPRRPRHSSQLLRPRHSPPPPPPRARPACLLRSHRVASITSWERRSSSALAPGAGDGGAWLPLRPRTPLLIALGPLPRGEHPPLRSSAPRQSLRLTTLGHSPPCCPT